ncbi:DUF3772 domain-containing protein [Tropicimonas sp.]|uniref:DUF3772 domain-containing protein n=1 Tax=Tropicimonas sp. TaxID=2067044 RepID=UPI003A8A8206
MMMNRLAPLLVSLFLAILTCSTALIAPTPLLAQSESALALDEQDYYDWNAVANRAEEALAAGRASTQAFDSLRQDLVTWRSKFQAAQSLNAAQISTLQVRIKSLGPRPKEGEIEGEQISALRSDLERQYWELRTPVLEATEAYTYADSLVSQVDRLLRERQQHEILERGPIPLNPAHLESVVRDFKKIRRILATESSTATDLLREQGTWWDTFIALLAVPAIALVLLVRGRNWFQRLVNWMVSRGGGSHRYLVVAMIVSLGQVILPVTGIVLLTAVLIATGVLGASGEALVTRTVPAMGMAFFTARWLGGQVFPRMSNWPTPLDLTRKERARGRLLSSALGVLVAVALSLREIFSIFPLEPGTGAVLAFPVIVLSAMCLAALSYLIMLHAQRSSAHKATDQSEPDAPDAPDERSFIDRIMLLIAQAGMIFALLGPVLALFGFTRAGIYFTVAPIMSLGLLALENYLMRLAVGIFGLFSPAGKKATDGLWPVLINFAIFVASLPLLAMIWGVRRADIAEFWNLIREGVEIGGTRISPGTILIFAAVFGVVYLLAGLFKGALRNSILPRTKLDEGAKNAVVAGVGYLGVFLAVLAAMSAAGIGLSNLAIVAGALSVGIGFGLQNIVSNFVSGLIMLIERPVSEGDWVEVGGVMGTVRKIAVRATTIETFDRTDVIVPNSDFISTQVTNWTHDNLSGRLILPVGVAYGSDTRKVAEILQEIAEAHPLVIVNPPPMIAFQNFGADALEFEIRVILRDITFGLATRTELNHRIAERFAEEGIEIPFAQRDIWLRNPEVLRAPGPDRPEPVPPNPHPLHPNEDRR